MDSTAIWGSVTAVLVVFMPFLLKWMDNRNESRKTREQYVNEERKQKAKEDREDELSDRVVKAVEAQTKKAAEQATELLASNAESIKVNAENLQVNTIALVAAKAQTVTLKEVLDVGKTTHLLVDSNLTISKQQARDGYVIALVSLRRNHGMEDPEIAKIIGEVETKLAVLDKELADRAEAEVAVADMRKSQGEENATAARVDALETKTLQQVKTTEAVMLRQVKATEAKVLDTLKGQEEDKTC